MSITNLEVIEDALREINVISETDSASPEQGKFGLRKLNQLMEVWREKDIEFGYFRQTATTGVCPIPDYAESAVTTALSVMVAPTYGATISAESAAVINDHVSVVQRKSISEMLDNADMTHLPVGQGHFGTRYDITTDS